MAPATIELANPPAAAAANRSIVYRALARAFRSPIAIAQSAQAGQLAAEVQQAASGLPYTADLGQVPSGPQLSAEALESAYLALFEVGGNQGSPCYLYEGEHGGGRNKVLEDVLRFYHYLGLRLDEDKRERPDHLATELEYMHALTFREAAALAAGKDPSALRMAQRDFLRLHLEPFLEAVASKLQGDPSPLYPALAGCAASFCRAELAYLASGA